jgi:hypothetical protein
VLDAAQEVIVVVALVFVTASARSVTICFNGALRIFQNPSRPCLLNRGVGDLDQCALAAVAMHEHSLALGIEKIGEGQ